MTKKKLNLCVSTVGMPVLFLHGNASLTDSHSYIISIDVAHLDSEEIKLLTSLIKGWNTEGKTVNELPSELLISLDNPKDPEENIKDLLGILTRHCGSIFELEVRMPTIRRSSSSGAPPPSQGSGPLSPKKKRHGLGA